MNTLTKELLGLTLLLLLSGCVGSVDEDEAVPYEKDADTDYYPTQDVAPAQWDSDIDPAASFDYNLNGLPFVGMNISGIEWESGSVSWPNARYEKGYHSYRDYFHGWGLRTVRLPFSWERLQPELRGEFAEQQWERLQKTVFDLRSNGAYVLLDVHNYARYNGQVVGEGYDNEDFADLWRRLARTFMHYPEIGFGLMNEPQNVSSRAWVDSANAAIAAIRELGARNLIFVNGNGWSGAHSWEQSWVDADSPGMANSDAMLQIEDPLGDDYTIFEAHQYLNANSSDWGECPSEVVGVQRMAGFTRWLRDNGKKGFLGEFGVQSDSVCLAALDGMLQHIADNHDVYVGWTWWSAGPGCVDWQAPTDPYCWKDGQSSSPQLDVLLDHIAADPFVYHQSYN